MESYLPDFCYRNATPKVRALIVHYISCIHTQPDDPFNLQNNWWLLHDLNCAQKDRVMYPGCTNWLPDPTKRTYASYHCMVGRDGQSRLLVPEYAQAYHAGVSSYKGLSDFNRCSLSISGLATAISGFTEEQYATMAKYAAGMIRSYDFPLEMVLGHEEISPGRKPDPGISIGNFNMAKFKGMIAEIL